MEYCARYSVYDIDTLCTGGVLGRRCQVATSVKVCARASCPLCLNVELNARTPPTHASWRMSFLLA
eukprot:4154015-Amphidinium_carterae.1